MYKMVTKQINLKNRLYYFWNDQIWINNFDAKNLVAVTRLEPTTT